MLNELLSGFATQVNRGVNHRSAFSIKVTTNFANVPFPLPPTALRAMRLQITCEQCGSTYAVIGAGFFCPLCGANSAHHTFHQSIAKSRIALSVARELPGTLTDADAAAEAQRVLVETQMGDLVTAFQRFAGKLFPRLPRSPEKGKRNLFQRLGEASQAWRAAGGRSFDTILDGKEWADITRYFQQRHLFEHTEGIVDEDYLRWSGDTTYKLGQRVSVRTSDIIRLAELVEKLGRGLEQDLPTHDPANTLGTMDVQTPAFPPKLPGVTDADWLVYRLVCEAAVRKDWKSLGGQEVWAGLGNDDELTGPDVGESLEVLEAKSLIKLAGPLRSDPIPAHITLTHRGLDIFFAYTMVNYQAERKRIAEALLQGQTASALIADQLGLSRLFVHHVLEEFERRRWIGQLWWSDGAATVALHTPVHLKRFVAS